MSAQEAPLGGLKVADFCWVVAGPTIGRALADYGAQVVRIDSPKRLETARVAGPMYGGQFGPENSALYGNMNAGKLGCSLDLSDERGRAVARDLCRWADVVLEAFAPGVMSRWGLGYDDIVVENPSVIMLSTSLMGQAGPYAQYAGYGNAGAAMAGFQNVVGWPGRPPIGPVGPYTDYVAPRFSLVALMAALDHRRRTGEGCYLDQSQAESGMHFMAQHFVDYAATGRVVAGDGNHDEVYAPHGVYACRPPADAARSYVAIAARDDAEWHRLTEVMGAPELGSDPRFATPNDRRARADELDELIGAWVAEQLAVDVEAVLQSVGIPSAVVASSSDALVDPQLVHRGHFVSLEHPLHGTAVVEASRFRLSRTPAVTDRPAPLYGQHNREVLVGLLGYDDARYDALVEDGVI